MRTESEAALLRHAFRALRSIKRRGRRLQSADCPARARTSHTQSRPGAGSQSALNQGTCQSMACGRQQRASSIRSALQHRSLRCNSGWASSLTLAASTWGGRTRGHCAASVSGGAAHRLWGCTALRAPSRPGSQAQLGSPEGNRRARALAEAWYAISPLWCVAASRRLGRPAMCLGGKPCAMPAGPLY